MAEHPRRRLLATLRARFDGAALSVSLPGHPAPPLALPTAAQWAGLQAWCFEGAGNGHSPLLRPRQAPQVDHRLSVAVWPADDPAALALIESGSAGAIPAAAKAASGVGNTSAFSRGPAFSRATLANSSVTSG